MSIHQSKDEHMALIEVVGATQSRKLNPAKIVSQIRVFESLLDIAMVNWCQHHLDDGAVLILMANRCKEYVRQEARRLGIESFFAW